jgi:hypothetical protein
MKVTNTEATQENQNQCHLGHSAKKLISTHSNIQLFFKND